VPKAKNDHITRKSTRPCRHLRIAFLSYLKVAALQSHTALFGIAQSVAALQVAHGTIFGISLSNAKQHIPSVVSSPRWTFVDLDAAPAQLLRALK
jgi:hypothetical protein